MTKTEYTQNTCLSAVKFQHTQLHGGKNEHEIHDNVDCSPNVKTTRTLTQPD